MFIRLEGGPHCIGMAHCTPRLAGESHERPRLPHRLPTEESDTSCSGEMVPLREGNGRPTSMSALTRLLEA
jgi:hypothetical protein